MSTPADTPPADTHVAMLLGAAQVLARMRDEVAGTVLFVFQPAEEGPPIGEDGGARLMVAQSRPRWTVRVR